MIDDVYKLEIKFPTDSGWNEYEAEFSGFSLTQKMHTSLKSADNVVNITLSHNQSLENKLRGLSDDGAEARIKKNNEIFFTGYIRKGFNIRNTGRVQSTSIEIVSPSFFLKRNIKETIRLLGQKVSYGAGSVLYSLFTHAGYSAAALSLLPTIDVELPYFIVEADKKTYFDVINSILFEYGYILDFNASGMPIAYEWSKSGISSSCSFTTGDNGNIHGLLTQNVKEETYEQVNIEWKSVKTLTNTNIFSDTQNATTSQKCVIDVAADSYYGEDEAGSEGLYLEYSCEDYDFLYAYDVQLDILKHNDLSVVEWTDYGTKGFLKLHNDNQTYSRQITKLDVNGTAIVKTATNTSKVVNSSGKFSKTTTYKAEYVYDKTNADALCSRLASYYKYSDFTYTLMSYDSFDVGAYCTVSDPETGSTLCRIVQKKTDEMTGLIAYTLEGCADYSPAVPSEEASSKPVNRGGTVALVQKVIPQVEHLIDVSNQYILDVSPSMQAVACDNKGNLKNPTDIVISVRLYYEDSLLTNNVTYTAKINNETVGTWSGNKCTLPYTIMTGDTVQVEFTATYGDITRTETGTITKLYAGQDADATWVQYDMLLSDNAVKVTDGTANPDKISVKKIKRSNEFQKETDYGHVVAVIDDTSTYKVNEYELDTGTGYDPQYEYKRKMKPFYLKIGGDAIEEDDKKVMVFYERVKE